MPPEMKIGKNIFGITFGSQGSEKILMSVLPRGMVEPGARSL